MRAFGSGAGAGLMLGLLVVVTLALFFAVLVAYLRVGFIFGFIVHCGAAAVLAGVYELVRGPR